MSKTVIVGLRTARECIRALVAHLRAAVAIASPGTPCRQCSNRDGVGDPKIVAECLRAQECALIVRAGQQVLNEVAAQPQLRFGEDALMSKLECQYSRSMLERDDVQTIGVAVRIVQEHHSKDVRLLPDKPEDPIAVTLGCAMRGRAPEYFFAVVAADRPVRIVAPLHQTTPADCRTRPRR